MPRTWKIGAMDVHGHSPKTQLVGCSIVLNKGAYSFVGPEPNFKVESTVPRTATGPADPPFLFPMFTSKLNGIVSRKWYIRVVDIGPLIEKADGCWSNTGDPGEGCEKAFRSRPTPGGPFGDPDVWTTQAGVGTGVQPEEDEAVAASAKM